MNNENHSRSSSDILVVDDVSENLKLLVDLLTRKGYKVRSASSGDEALDAVKRKKTDLILLDINMPGMDGFEVCKRLKADSQSEIIPIIFISGLSEINDKVKAFQAGGVDYIGKPFQEEEVLMRVQTHIELQRMRMDLESIVAERTQELKAAKERAEDTQRFISTLVDVFQATLFAYWTPDLRLRYANRAFAAFFGYTPEEIIGLHFSDISEPALFEGNKPYFDAALRGEAQSFELTGIHINGQEFHSLTQYVPDKGDESVKGFFGLVTDITPLKEAQIKLEHLNITLQAAKKEADSANQAKSIFLSNMSHELRTPLNAILGFAQLIARDVSTGEEQRKQIGIISRSGNHLLTLINDILDITKIETGRATLNTGSFDLSVFLDEISDLFHNRMIEKGLSFIIEKNDDLPRYIKSDEGKLRQVLINLLGNARKFTETGGVTLRVRSGAVAENIQTLLFEVEDTGMGIDSNHLENIFEPFAQAGHAQTGIEGTGLGLSICKSFVALLGGEISVESKPGEGTMFHFNVPVALAESAEASGIGVAMPEVLGLESGQSAWRILVAEDNAENRLLLNSLLVQVGFDTRQAENGKEAVTLFEQWQPHFIWMDIRMPVMDGYQATAKIRSLPGGDEVKIIALTASVFKEQHQSILEAGCDEVMHKPYQPHEIFETMSEQLGVQYIYEEEIDKSSSSAEKVIDIELAKEMADSLPEQLHNELEQAAIALDMEKTYEVLERISEIQPKLADLLRIKVEEMDFSNIRKVLNHE